MGASWQSGGCWSGGGSGSGSGPAPVPASQYEDLSAQPGPNYTVTGSNVLRVRILNNQTVSTITWPGAKVTDMVTASFHGGATRRYDAYVSAPDTVVASVNAATGFVFDLFLQVTA